MMCSYEECVLVSAVRKKKTFKNYNHNNFTGPLVKVAGNLLMVLQTYEESCEGILINRP